MQWIHSNILFAALVGVCPASSALAQDAPPSPSDEDPSGTPAPPKTPPPDAASEAPPTSEPPATPERAPVDPEPAEPTSEPTSEPPPPIDAKPIPAEPQPKPPPTPKRAPVDPEPAEPKPEDLPWYRPVKAETDARPSRPRAPEPPQVALTASGYTQIHSFVGGGVEGTATEVGVRLGVDSGYTALSLGVLASEGLPVFGIETLRTLGYTFNPGSTYEISLLGMALGVKAYTDFSESLFLTGEVSVLGARVASCTQRGAPLPFFVDVRAPYATAWAPLIVGRQELGTARAAVLVSWGVGIEAGLLFF